MNNTYNFRIPEFCAKYGLDWEDFCAIMEECGDYYVDKIWGIRHLFDLNRMDGRSVNSWLSFLKIAYKSLDDLGYRKFQIRINNSLGRKKSLTDPYKTVCEYITGNVPDFYSSESFGSWVWGDSAWFTPQAVSSNAMRWGAGGSQKEIMINPHTTDDSLLDALVEALSRKNIKPAFYVLLLVDDNLQVLRRIG
ncbi:MAG: hypothetical protein PF637_06095 [Spirochaetes bacterium]|jgi:hypothetical protein|nr:hypothetical protein [Spirochaetota bacterium]